MPTVYKLIILEGVPQDRQRNDIKQSAAHTNGLEVRVNCGRPKCPLRVITGSQKPTRILSAMRGKADAVASNVCLPPESGRDITRV